MKQAKSNNRLKAREVEKKFTPALKALSQYLHNTGEVPDDFLGYKIPAGEVKDNAGRTWQIQAHAVVSKKLIIKKDEVVPMISKWAILMKIRVFAKYLIDWSSKN